MHRNLITKAIPPLVEKPVATEASLQTKFQAIRTQPRLIGREIAASEGRLLDFNIAETVQRALHHTGRQLDAIAINYLLRPNIFCNTT